MHLEYIQLWQLVVAITMGGIVPAVAVITSMKSSIAAILARFDDMARHVDKAHDRLDQHVVDFHSNYFKDREH